mmetsp:Transcript_32817/g.94248  ORF Transcript_32817/g.94248 Transcript_32817/m.94248 type:complete len:212 (+) Transcript_32817:77-712(+)
MVYVSAPAMPFAFLRGSEGSAVFSTEAQGADLTDGAFQAAGAPGKRPLLPPPEPARGQGEEPDAAEQPAEAKRRRIVGHSDARYMYECTRFVWRNKRESCATEPDRKFSTKRMALLYTAKMNSDSVLKFAGKAGKKWTDLCSDSGPHAVCPNVPFDAERFLELSDDVLERYAESAGSILSVRKAPEGASYKFRAVSLETMPTEELAALLRS